MADAHIGRWLLSNMEYRDGPSRWKPRAGYAEFFPDGRYRCGDLEGTDEAGQWVAEGDVVLAEDLRLGTVASWRMRSPGVLVRDLSDEDTGYRGEAQMSFREADAAAFAANARKHLETLRGLGVAASEALVDAGVLFPRDLAALGEGDLDRVAAATGLDRARLETWRKAAGGR